MGMVWGIRVHVGMVWRIRVLGVGEDKGKSLM